MFDLKEAQSNSLESQERAISVLTEFVDSMIEKNSKENYRSVSIDFFNTSAIARGLAVKYISLEENLEITFEVIRAVSASYRNAGYKVKKTPSQVVISW